MHKINTTITRMKYILKIRLNVEARHDFRLIGEFDRQFIVADWQGTFCKKSSVGVEATH